MRPSSGLQVKQRSNVAYSELDAWSEKHLELSLFPCVLGRALRQITQLSVWNCVEE